MCGFALWQPLFPRATEISQSDSGWAQIWSFPTRSDPTGPVKSHENSIETTVLLISLVCVSSKQLQDTFAVFYEGFQQICCMWLYRDFCFYFIFVFIFGIISEVSTQVV